MTSDHSQNHDREQDPLERLLKGLAKTDIKHQKILESTVNNNGKTPLEETYRNSMLNRISNRNKKEHTKK